MRRWVQYWALAVLTAIAGLVATADLASAKPWLGIQLSPVTDDIREGLSLPSTGGVIVSRVLPGGAAERADLQRGDVILRFDDREVGSPQELIAAIGGKHEGDDVSIELVRAGVRRSIGVRVGSTPTTGEYAERTHLVRTSYHATSAGMWVFLQFRDPYGVERVWSGLPAALDDETLRKLLDVTARGGEFGLPLRASIIGADAARLRLGARVVPLDDELAARLGCARARGALVVGILPGTTAQTAGLLPGDVVAAVNGLAVESPGELDSHLNPLGDQATLAVWRGAQRLNVHARLTPKPRDPMNDRMLEAMEQPRPESGEVVRTWKVEPPTDLDWEQHLQDVLFADPDRPAPTYGTPAPEPRPGSIEDLRRQVDDLHQQVQELRRKLDSRTAR